VACSVVPLLSVAGPEQGWPPTPSIGHRRQALEPRPQTAAGP